ncbi:MAG: hypothetical protein WC979_07790 [Candidatus Pacearchaeota archaeon]|jgi:hypothetical protein
MTTILTAEEIRDYFFQRLTSPVLSGQSQLLLGAQIKGVDKLTLFTHARKRDHNVEYTFQYNPGELDRIQIGVEALNGGVSEKDFSYFLTSLVSNDSIFGPDGFLCPRTISLEKSIERAKTVFRRNDDPLGNIMACSFDSSSFNADELKPLIYDYMGRPCIHYLFHSGTFV